MTQPWPNAAIKPDVQRSFAAEVSPENLAQACRKLATSMFGGALIQIGFAFVYMSRGLAALGTGSYDFGSVFGLLGVLTLMTGVWFSLSSWDNPHRGEAFKEISYHKLSAMPGALLAALGVRSLAAIFVGLLGSTWLMAEFGIPVGVSKIMVAIGSMMLATVMVGQAGYLLGVSTRNKAL